MKNKDTSNYNSNDMAAILGGATDVWGGLTKSAQSEGTKAENEVPAAKTKKSKKRGKKFVKSLEEAPVAAEEKKSKKRKSSEEVTAPAGEKRKKKKKGLKTA